MLMKFYTRGGAPLHEHSALNLLLILTQVFFSVNATSSFYPTIFSTSSRRHLHAASMSLLANIADTRAAPSTP